MCPLTTRGHGPDPARPLTSRRKPVKSVEWKEKGDKVTQAARITTTLRIVNAAHIKKGGRVQHQGDTSGSTETAPSISDSFNVANKVCQFS